MPRPPERLRGGRRASAGRGATAAATVVGAILALAGCSGLGAPGATGAPPSPSAAVSPSATASGPAAVDPDPVLVPGGTAADNLPLFTAVTATVWGSPGSASGRAYIDALVAAGFDKTAMQVTQDQSTVGNPAESLQFSVLWGDECLIGQVGPATGSPVTVVVPALVEGECLVGETRPVDW